MPSFAPRDQPIKKVEELSKRQYNFIQSIRKNLAMDKIYKAAEKYRQAQLSLLKAKAHVAMEEVYRKHLDNFDLSALEENIEVWKKKSVDYIIIEFKRSQGIE